MMKNRRILLYPLRRMPLPSTLILLLKIMELRYSNSRTQRLVHLRDLHSISDIIQLRGGTNTNSQTQLIKDKRVFTNSLPMDLESKRSPTNTVIFTLMLLPSNKMKTVENSSLYSDKNMHKTMSLRSRMQQKSSELSQEYN
jgi:hypothetical protein